MRLCIVVNPNHDESFSGGINLCLGKNKRCNMDFENQTMLVTGGTGSFGNFIVAKLLEEGVGELRVLSRDEKKQYDMRNRFSGEERLKCFVGDIRDRLRVDEVMEGVDIVFQAAALKQVVSCENSPQEAIRTNILGVGNVIYSAARHKVPKVICLSTYTAVKPVNVMGMTKALQERLTISANRRPGNNSTMFSCIRYGNVMSSRGSAIPFFRDMVKQGKVMTITDVRMTRFLLTLWDAMDLVIFAAKTMQGGEIFVKKSPATKIVDLAEVISEEVGKEFKYEEIGVFPGEKLHEILISEEELPRTQDLGAYFCVNPWWHEERYEEVEREYCSKDCLVGFEEIGRLLEKSDAEFAKIRYDGAIFSKI